MLTGKIKMTIGPDLHAKVGSTLRGSVAGVDDHRKLRYRDELNQHPMKAITGLVETIKNINEKSTTLVEDVRDLKIAAQYVDIAIGELAETDLYLSETKQDALESYLKTASIVGGSLRIITNDDDVVEFTPQGGGEKSWRLIKNAVVPADPSSDTSGVTWVTNANGIYRFVIDDDNDGNPFSYKKVRLIAKTPSKEAGGICTNNWRPQFGIDIPTPSGNAGWILLPYNNNVYNDWASVIVEIKVEADGLVKTELDGSTNVVYAPMPNYFLDYASKHFENRSLPSGFESNPPASITNVVLHTDKPIKPGVIVELYAEV